MNAARRMVIVVTTHPDGTITSRDWMGVDSDKVAEVEQILGAPSFEAMIAGPVARELAPQVAGASIVVDGS